jgi:hypothetical protein
VCVYTPTYIHTHTHTHIHIYIYRERERERDKSSHCNNCNVVSKCDNPVSHSSYCSLLRCTAVYSGINLPASCSSMLPPSHEGSSYHFREPQISHLVPFFSCYKPAQGLLQ